MGQLDSSEARNMRDWETSFPTTVSCTFPGRQLLWEQGEVGAEGSPQPSFQRGLLPCPSRTQSWGTAMLDPAGSTGKRSHQQAREGRWQNGTLSPTGQRERLCCGQAAAPSRARQLPCWAWGSALSAAQCDGLRERGR